MRRNINMLVVFLATILSGLLLAFNLVGIIPVIMLFLVFNIVSLVFYGETRLFIAYHIVTMFLIIGYFVTTYNLIAQSELAMLFMAFMDIGSFAIFFISFGIILQNRSKLTLEVTLMIVALYNIIFYSNTRFTVMAYIVGIFRTTDLDSVDRILYIFNLVNLSLMFAIALTQVYLIYKFDKRLSKQEYLEKRRIQKIEKLFY